jgi:hypothetical protein
MIAAILAALLTLCSLAIERVMGDKKTANTRQKWWSGGAQWRMK